ncbi:tetratricopeptide repeat protein [Sphingomonas aerophila]|uniref:Tetratricopeptide (TPR) repeat protein n=1 Tax=Sphingomonas aerophila TaxID=1344948 RepID=A0A7W9BD84_9SPHN|nr:tetratricopeptide repeat protein [Sphingomonas aerophila]MBB5714716.1 tetratricopeptide (TPR) repeat protein [Sphingomonas aerophila]
MADTGGLAAYLSARAADASGEPVAASAAYARALDAEPDNALIAIRAYRESLDAGDDVLARRAAAVLDRAGVAPADAALLPLAQAARAGDAAAAQRAAARLTGGPLRILVPSLLGWIAFSQGVDASGALDAASGDALSRRLATETRALLLIARGQTATGLAALEAVRGGDGDLDLRLTASQLLSGQGRRAEAAALLPGQGPLERAFRAGVPAKPTLGFAVSRLLTRVAADLGEETAAPLLVALTRAAINADPTNDRARVILATSLARGGVPGPALSVLGQVGADAPLAGLAAATRVSILNGAGRTAEALPAARARAEATDASSNDWQRYGDLLATAERFDEAARWYKRAVDAAPNSWSAWMQYGGALDRGGRWPEARAALERAVALGPTEPLALNYLGYARIARGEAVQASAKLLERASALDPDNAAITDSLGWAYYLTGQTTRALPLIERAAAAQPGDADIGEHLGDVYWSLGRRYEARYAWRAAALGAEGDLAARLTGKIASGLLPRR